MKLLLDTHALLWWLDGDRRLSSRARILIADENNPVSVSAASAWEIATKVRSGKLPGAVEVAERLPEILFEQTFREMPVTVVHARRAGLMQSAHRDPFDRMLIAQAQLEDVALVSNERLFDSFGICRAW